MDATSQPRHEFETHVAASPGEGLLQAAVSGVPIGAHLEVAPDPQPHDRHALSLWWQGRRIGFVPSTHVLVFHKIDWREMRREVVVTHEVPLDGGGRGLDIAIRFFDSDSA